MRKPVAAAIMTAALFIAMTTPHSASAQAPPPPAVPDLPAIAAKAIVVDVWPGNAPGETTRKFSDRLMMPYGKAGMVNISAARLLVFPLAGGIARPAIVVLPGGGYNNLAIDHEGFAIANWINSIGCTAAILEYRVPDKRDGALQDAQRAMSLLRSRASEFSIDPNRLGILGFSAGGHLTARLAASGDAHSYPHVDAADDVSCQPDFALLIYPAYLTGKDGKPNPEVAPHVGEPPIFLTQTKDDYYLDAPAYSEALTAVGVPNRCVIYDTGGHGYGLDMPTTAPAHAWPHEAAKWILEQVSR